MENNAAPFVLRAATDADVPFLFNSFLKSYRDAPAVAGIPNGLYYAGQHALIETLLKRSYVIIACADDDPTQIMGYIIGEHVGAEAIVHWLYVKHSFRSFGIGRALEKALVNDRDVSYTHRVRLCERLLKNRPAYVFNPFLLHKSDK